MKVLLMHQDRDFDRRPGWPCNESALSQDLAIDTLLHAMAGDDEFLSSVARDALFSGLRNDVETILYRQGALRDCFRNPQVIGDLYHFTVETLGGTRKYLWGLSSDHPNSMLYSSIDLMAFFLQALRKLRVIAEQHAGGFESGAFTTLFAMLRRELDDEYLATIQGHLTALQFRKGVLLSAGLGERNEGVRYVLGQTPEKNGNWLKRFLGQGPVGYAFRLHDRDEAGARILSDMRNVGISRVAVALAQSAEHVKSFFEVLRTELAFYIGCLNLHARLIAKGEPVCFPFPFLAGERRHSFRGLYDPCLSLLVDHRVIGNTADADGKNLVVVTGANQGGKSIFLRSVGLAQMMMQSGMFVAAESFGGELCTGLFTHYKREEDPTMKSGKLDEELARMSEIVERITPNSMLLCNESFAATNEREGSEIARQIISALLEKGIKVFFVTHQYELAHGLFDKKAADAIFLRAERRADGTRTFKVIEGEPLETSYGKDLYQELFPVETSATRNQTPTLA